MLNKLAQTLKKGFDQIAGAIFLDKKLIETLVKDLQRALIQSDVNIHLVKEIGEKIKEEGKNEKIKGIEKKEHLTKILHDEILNLLGKEKHEIKIDLKKQNKILLLGLYGVGKTTTCAKMAAYYSKRGYRVAILGLDVHRPAASEQLKQLGEQIKVPVFTDKLEKDPLKIYNKYKKELEKFNLIIIDSAGRHNLDKGLTKEIKILNKKINPEHRFLVIQADIGQAAKTQALEFQKACNINGVIITRMDSSAKAGGALTACNETKARVFFIGNGEKINDLEKFNPKAFISRLLGLGDLEGLLEKVQSAVNKKHEKKLTAKLKKGEFNLRDLQEQLKQMKGLGNFSKIMEMIPGVNKMKIPEKALDNQEGKIKNWEHIIDSMTKEEIENPIIIEKQTKRLSRIAKGSGSKTNEIRQLLKQYKLIKEMSLNNQDISNDFNQGLSQKQMQKLAKKFGKKFKF